MNPTLDKNIFLFIFQNSVIIWSHKNSVHVTVVNKLKQEVLTCADATISSCKQVTPSLNSKRIITINISLDSEQLTLSESVLRLDFFQSGHNVKFKQSVLFWI